MLVDKTGRELKEGQVVDIPINRMLTGVVREVHDSPMHTPEGTVPPRVYIELLPFFAVAQDGKTCQSVYIVDEKLGVKKPEPSKLVLVQ